MDSVVEFLGRPTCAHHMLTRSARVFWALKRLSRDRWLSPKDVLELGVRLARCISGNPHSTFNAAMNSPEWMAVGLLRGSPPFRLGSSVYQDFIQETRRQRSAKAAPIELSILNLKLKEKQLGN